MSKFHFSFVAMTIVVFTLMSVSVAHAQATRTWVSGVGE